MADTFNMGKCKVMHLISSNSGYEYFMEGHKLEITESEKDVGVHIHHSMKLCVHVAEAVKKANLVPGQLVRCITYRDKVYFLGLYVQRV